MSGMMHCVFNSLSDFMGGQAHDKMACLKPHPSPISDPALAKKQHQQQQLKRKRTNSYEQSPFKRQKAEFVVSTPPKANQAPTWNSATYAPAPKAAVAPSPVSLPQAAAAGAATTTTTTASPAPVRASAPVLATPAPQSLPASDVPQPQQQSEAPVESKPVQAMQHESAATIKGRAHDRIEANLNLQILLKHDELRLIEQELGKCQVALEQIRRCKIVPFPGQPGSRFAADDIVSGKGPSVKPQPGLLRPSHMAPYGVTDGPYSRHYAQWLIPDPTFDPSPPRPPRLSTSSFAMQNRSSRMGYDNLNSATTPRSARASMPSATIPGTASVPKDRNAPLTVPRPSDGKLVKMVCKVCGKKDSANVQGFTNHCRIAHGINYASHSEAILDCGQLVSNDELPASVPPTPTAPAAPAAPTEPKSAIIPCAPPQNPNRPAIHPLITTTKTTHGPSAPLFGDAARPLPKSELVETSAKPETEFIASPENPHLSALLKKRGISTDLKSLVTESKQKIDLTQVSPLISDDEEESQPSSLPGSSTATPLRQSGKPKARRPGMAHSGVRVPNRPQTGQSGLQINTSSTTASVVNDSSPQNSAITPSVSSSKSSTKLGPSATSEAKGTSATSNGHVLHGVESPGVASSMENDRSDMPENIGEFSTSSANLSPHAIDTNPGLVTDNEDDAEFADSDRESVDQASDAGRHVDMNVKVREEDCRHNEDLMQDIEHTSVEKTTEPRPLPHNLVERRSVNGAPNNTPRKRGRPRKNPPA